MMWWGYGGWGGWVWMSVLMLLFWGGLIWLLITGLQDEGLRDKGSERPAAARTAEDILAERFAGGEIDEPEFQERLRVLHSGLGDPAMRAGRMGVAK